MSADGTDLDRAVVEVLALLFEPVPRSTVAKAITTAKLHRSVPLDEMHARLQALARAGTVVEQGGGWAVAPAARHRALLEIVGRGDLERLARAVRSARPPKVDHFHHPNGRWADLLRELQLALYAGRWDELRAGLPRVADPWPVLAGGMDPAWLFDHLPADLATDAVVQVVSDATLHQRPCPEWAACLEALPPAALDDDQHHHLVRRLVLEGRHEEARRLAGARPSSQAAVDRAWLQLLAGDAPGAADAFEAALTAFLKAFGKRARLFPDPASLFFVLALLAAGRVERARVVAEMGAAKGVTRSRTGMRSSGGSRPPCSPRRSTRWRVPCRPWGGTRSRC